MEGGTAYRGQRKCAAAWGFKKKIKNNIRKHTKTKKKHNTLLPTSFVAHHVFKILKQQLLWKPILDYDATIQI